MKPTVEFHIQKFTKPYKKRGTWEYWDGPFKSEKIAQKKFDESYRNEGMAYNQDFRIIRVELTALPFVPREPAD
jgi:hypothetical protein